MISVEFMGRMYQLPPELFVVLEEEKEIDAVSKKLTDEFIGDCMRYWPKFDFPITLLSGRLGEIAERYVSKLCDAGLFCEAARDLLISYSSNESSAIFEIKDRLNREWIKAVTYTEINGNRQEDTMRQREAMQHVLKHTLHPIINKELTYVIHSMWRKYRTHTGLLNDECSSHRDMAGCRKMLENIPLTKNVVPLLHQAFEACPYNLQLYVLAVRYGQFTPGMVDTLHRFGLQDAFVGVMFQNINWKKGIDEETRPYAMALMYVSERYPKEKLRGMSASMHDKCRDAYAEVGEMLKNGNIRLAMPADRLINADEDVQRQIVAEVIARLPDAQEFELLRTSLGWDDLLTEMSEVTGIRAESKAALDTECQRRLYELVVSQSTQLQTHEKATLHHESLYTALIVLLLILPVVLYGAVVNRWKAGAEEYVRDAVKLKLHWMDRDHEFMWNGIYAWRDYFSIENIRFYTDAYGTEMTIVPTLQFYAGDNEIDPAKVSRTLSNVLYEQCRDEEVLPHWLFGFSGDYTVIASRSVVVDSAGRTVLSYDISRDLQESIRAYEFFFNLRNVGVYTVYALGLLYLFRAAKNRMWKGVARQKVQP